MKSHGTHFRNAWLVLAGMMAVVAAALPAFSQPDPAATAAFDAYVHKVNARIDQQHRSPERFLAAVPQGAEQQLQNGEAVIDQLSPDGGAELSNALLHHWRGTAFVRGATAAELDRLLRDFPAYPRIFAPQVTRAAVLSGSGDGVQIRMRVVQKHVLTVVMDTTYNVTFGRRDARHGWSTSRSARIAEIEKPGTPRERVLSPAESHGFLWRLDTWWSYEERDGGLYIQLESVSLTRGIPAGLGWAVRPFLQSIPRDSIAFTLGAATKTLRAENGREK